MPIAAIHPSIPILRPRLRDGGWCLSQCPKRTSSARCPCVLEHLYRINRAIAFGGASLRLGPQSSWPEGRRENAPLPSVARFSFAGGWGSWMRRPDWAIRWWWFVLSAPARGTPDRRLGPGNSTSPCFERTWNCGTPHGGGGLSEHLAGWQRGHSQSSR